MILQTNLFGEAPAGNTDKDALGLLKWSPVKGYEGLYEASSAGVIRSVDRVSPHPKGDLRIQGRLMKFYVMNQGYMVVTLCKLGAPKKLLVHRVVAEAFLQVDDKRGFVNHIDGNRKNNALLNLEFCTSTENMANAVFRGRFHGRTNVKARKKLTPVTADAIKREVDIGTPYGVISASFGISKSSISAIKYGRIWGLPDGNGSLGIGWRAA